MARNSTDKQNMIFINFSYRFENKTQIAHLALQVGGHGSVEFLAIYPPLVFRCNKTRGDKWRIYQGFGQNVTKQGGINGEEFH